MENPRLSSREDIVVLVTSYFPLPCQRTFGFAGGQEPELPPSSRSPSSCPMLAHTITSGPFTVAARVRTRVGLRGAGGASNRCCTWYGDESNTPSSDPADSTRCSSADCAHGNTEALAAVAVAACQIFPLPI